MNRFEYLSQLNTYDWYTTSSSTRNDSLWTTSKTVYDPCPAGWKVPPVDAFSSTYFSTTTMSYSSSNYGRIHTASGTQWPESGLITNGNYGEVGMTAIWWSSTVSSSTYAPYYTISNSSAYTIGTYIRNYAYNVRCVKSSQNLYE